MRTGRHRISVDCSKVTFRPSDSCVQDEFAIVQFLRDMGLLAKPMTAG